MALTKEKRDSLDDNDFAVPSKRALPIHDETHVRMAHSMLDKTKGLTPEEKKEAQKRIVNKAKELGMDTSNWDLSADAETDDPDLQEDKEMEIEEENFENQHAQAFQLSALAMEIPDQPKYHPNQMKFKGVLTKLDEPSDNPLNGSNGKRVIMPRDVAEKALPSLLGMAVDFTPNLDGHDVKSKIGIITAANIVGNEIQIEGFFYNADFPSETSRIQAEKSLLGFSFEAQAYLRSMSEDPLVIKNCVFTGAAVLYKDKAAYTTTSLSARADLIEDSEMSEKILKMLEVMQASISKLEEKVAAVSAASAEQAKVAAGSLQHMVKPHADALRDAANNMKAAGMGMHPKQGHVAVLHNMADNMEAEAVMGKMPHTYQTPDFYSASSSTAEDKKENEVLNSALKKMQESIDSLGSKVVDLEKSKFAAAAEPSRKTLDPAIMSLLAKTGVKIEGDDKTDLNSLDKILDQAKVSTSDRIRIKTGLREAGKI